MIQLQLFAKDHKDAKLMVEVMKLLKRNNLPLQPGTADIVFRFVGYNLCHFMIKLSSAKKLGSMRNLSHAQI